MIIGVGFYALLVLTVNVHNDYRTHATEFINFLSVVITARVKREIVKKEINKNHSYKQVFKYLSKYKKVRIKEGGIGRMSQCSSILRISSKN